MHHGSYNVTVDCPGASKPVVKRASLTGKQIDVSITFAELR